MYYAMCTVVTVIIMLLCATRQESLRLVTFYWNSFYWTGRSGCNNYFESEREASIHGRCVCNCICIAPCLCDLSSKIYVFKALYQIGMHVS